MSESKMLSEKQDGIGRMIFNNPERHNAVSLDMWDAVEEILKSFVEDESIRVVVLAGAGGKAFVSGADISKFDSERGSKEAVLNYNKRVGAVYRFVHEFPKPTIAEVNGYCIGGGLGLAVCCDLRFCSEKSKFGLPAAKLGLGYGFEALKRLVDTVGPGVSRDIAFSARRLDADRWCRNTGRMAARLSRRATLSRSTPSAPHCDSPERLCCDTSGSDRCTWAPGGTSRSSTSDIRPRPESPATSAPTRTC